MAVPRTLTTAEADEVFGEAIGAILRYEQQVAGQLPAPAGPLIKPNGRASLDTTETARVTTGLRRASILQIGYLCYVLPWERYRRIVNLPVDQQPSLVFGLDGYSQATSAALTAAYPGTVTHAWAPPVGGGRAPPNFWFAKNVRNALAHGQVEWAVNAATNVESIRFYNQPAHGPSDFDVAMPADQFLKLIVSHALVQFVAKTVPPPANANQSNLVEPLHSVIGRWRLREAIPLH